MSESVVVLVTCGTQREALLLARAVVSARLAACVNIHGAPVRSIYRWKGKVEDAKEWLLVIKTTRRRFAALQRKIVGLHSYDVPEIIALPIAAGLASYLSWVDECVAAPAKRPPVRRHRTGSAK